jgi:hypothetical protein
VDDWGHCLSSLMWLSSRGIRASRIHMKIDAWLMLVCDILEVDTSDLVALGLRDCCNIGDRCLLDIINRLP